MSPLWVLTYTIDKILGPDDDCDESKKITATIETDLENPVDSINLYSTFNSATASQLRTLIAEAIGNIPASKP